eukprot:6214750-Pleurochrysis_carterae.AAC.2
MSARDTIIGAIIRGLSKSVELKRLLFGLYLLVRLAVKLRSISLSMRTPQLQPPNGCKSSCGISDYSFLERRTLGFKPQLRRRSVISSQLLHAAHTSSSLLQPTLVHFSSHLVFADLACPLLVRQVFMACFCKRNMSNQDQLLSLYHP